MEKWLLLVVVLVVSSGFEGLHGLDNIHVNVDNSEGFATLPQGAIGPINPGFAGFSVEWSGVWSYLTPTAFNNTLRLYQNLKEASGSPPVLRIGGNSADFTWANLSGSATPPWPTPYDMTSVKNFFGILNSFFDQLGPGAQFVLSLNFRVQNNTQYAVNESNYIASYLSPTDYRNLKAIEIGNEVDLYPSNGYRPSTWTTAQFNQEWNAEADAVDTAINPSKTLKYQGAIFCCVSSWFNYLPTYIVANKDRLATVSVHSYPENVCNGNTANLYTLVTSHNAPTSVYLKGLPNATAAGLEYWLGETNSVACGGANNISNTFGSALWGIDWMFNSAQQGYRGVNFHGGWTGAYTPIATGNPLVARPLYYAMLAVATTIGGSNTYVYPKTQGPSFNYTVQGTILPSQISIWTFVDVVSGVRKVVVNNRNLNTTASNANINITFSTASELYENAVLSFLSAPTIYSVTGVTFQGQTFDGSTDGSIQGTLANTTVKASSAAPSGFTWTFTMKPASTAFLVICVGQNSVPCGGTSSFTSSSASRQRSLWTDLL